MNTIEKEILQEMMMLEGALGKIAKGAAKLGAIAIPAALAGHLVGRATKTTAPELGALAGLVADGPSGAAAGGAGGVIDGLTGAASGILWNRERKNANKAQAALDEINKKREERAAQLEAELKKQKSINRDLGDALYSNRNR